MSANAVIALADGLMNEGERESWQTHLADCGLCRELVAVLVDERPPALPLPASGEMVGRYTILERLGMGGFGVVFRAHDTQLERDVALKLWRVDALSSGDEARINDLVEEARALAKLSHPSVMAVYDAGRDGERVFLAGELIEGASLYAKTCVGEHDVSPEDLAKWMAQCAYGLAAAHDVGLIHRDVKPDNILIGDDGRARVVDFGLSTSAFAADETPEIAGSLAGTPAYMSPEELRGEPASELSDQYSLCASFYEACHGKRLVAAENLETLKATANTPQIPVLDKRLPARLRKVLRQGLQTEPSQRHASMAALAAALRPKGASRIVPFVFGSVVAVAAGMAVLWTSSEQGAKRDCSAVAAPMKHVWSAERAALVEKSFGMFGSLYAKEAFAQVDASLTTYSGQWQSAAVAACEATYHELRTSEAMFDRQMLCLERRLGEVESLVDFMTEADLALMKQAPRAVSQLVALSHCSDREALSNLPPLPDDPEQRKRLRTLEAALAKAEGSRFAGRYEEATRVANDAMAQSKALGYAPLEAEAAFELGYVWSYRSDVEKSVVFLEDAHHKALASRDFRTSARAAVELVLLFGSFARDYEKAAEWTKHADSAVAAAGNDKLLRSNLENNLGDIARQQNQLEEALQHHQRALDLRKELYGPTDRSVAQSLNNLGMVKHAMGEYAAAASYYYEALGIFRSVLGEHHPHVGATAGNLGSIYLDIDNPEKANELFALALEIAVDTHGEESLPALRARFNATTVLGELGQQEQAYEQLLVLADSASKNFSEERLTLAQVTNSLGVIATQLDKFTLAEKHFRDAIALYKEVHGETHPDVFLATFNLGQALSRQERAKEALTLMDAVVAGYTEVAGPEHPMTANALSTRAEVFLKLGRADKAAVDLRAAEAIHKAQDGSPVRRADLELLWGQQRWLAGEKAEARSRVENALKLYKECGAKGLSGIAAGEEWLESHAP
jgi:tetratricopeptide (TPR) repeat protein